MSVFFCVTAWRFLGRTFVCETSVYSSVKRPSIRLWDGYSSLRRLFIWLRDEYLSVGRLSLERSFWNVFGKFVVRQSSNCLLRRPSATSYVWWRACVDNYVFWPHNWVNIPRLGRRILLTSHSRWSKLVTLLLCLECVFFLYNCINLCKLYVYLLGL